MESLSEPLEGTTWILDFWLPELWGNAFLLFVVICVATLGNRR